MKFRYWTFAYDYLKLMTRPTTIILCYIMIEFSVSPPFCPSVHVTCIQHRHCRPIDPNHYWICACVLGLRKTINDLNMWACVTWFDHVTRYVTRTENSARATNYPSVGTENNIHGRRRAYEYRQELMYLSMVICIYISVSATGCFEMSAPFRGEILA